MTMINRACLSLVARVAFVALCVLAPSAHIAPGFTAAASATSSATAIFAGGCFWSMEHVFDELPGVISVTVGYAGGAAKNPSYEQVEMGITGQAHNEPDGPDSCRTMPPDIRQLIASGRS